MSEATKENPYRLSSDQVARFLPHRYPFLLVDRVLEIHPTGDLKDTSANNKVGTRVVAIKNISVNEPQFTGHFPGFAIYPGVLMIETMAQVSSFATYPYIHETVEKHPGSYQCILVGVDNTRFRKPIVPGDTLRIESVVTKCRGRLWAFSCTVTVDGQKVAEADLMANLIPTMENAQ